MHRLVCVQAVIALMEMGFDEKEVVDALRVNNNQQDAAVCKHSENHKITSYFNSQLRLNELSDIQWNVWWSLCFV